MEDVTSRDIRGLVDHMLSLEDIGDVNHVLRAMKAPIGSRDFGAELTKLFAGDIALRDKFFNKIVGNYFFKTNCLVACELFLGIKGVGEDLKGLLRNMQQQNFDVKYFTLEKLEELRDQYAREQQESYKPKELIHPFLGAHEIMLAELKQLRAENAANVEKTVEVPKVKEPSVETGPDDDAGLVRMPLVGGKKNEEEAEIDRKLEFSLCVAEFEAIENESVKQVFKYEIFELIRQRDDDKSESATARLNNLKHADVQAFVREVNKTISADKEVTPKVFQKLMANKNTPSSINHVFAGVKADAFAAEKKAGLLSKLGSKLGSKKEASGTEQDAGPKKGLKDLLPKGKPKYHSVTEPLPRRFGRGSSSKG